MKRMQSALLLEVPLVFQEFPHQVLPALAKASGADVSAELAAQAGHCAALSAQHVSVEQHPPLGLPQLRQDALDPPSQRSQYYALLTALLSGVRRPLAALVPSRPRRRAPLLRRLPLASPLWAAAAPGLEKAVTPPCLPPSRRTSGCSTPHARARAERGAAGARRAALRSDLHGRAVRGRLDVRA